MIILNCTTTRLKSRFRSVIIQGAYYGTIHQLDYGSTASYNAMLLSIQHRLAKQRRVPGAFGRLA